MGNTLSTIENLRKPPVDNNLFNLNEHIDSNKLV